MPDHRFDARSHYTLTLTGSGLAAYLELDDDDKAYAKSELWQLAFDKVYAGYTTPPEGVGRQWIVSDNEEGHVPEGDVHGILDRVDLDGGDTDVAIAEEPDCIIYTVYDDIVVCEHCYPVVEEEEEAANATASAASTGTKSGASRSRQSVCYVNSEDYPGVSAKIGLMMEWGSPDLTQAYVVAKSTAKKASGQSSVRKKWQNSGKTRKSSPKGKGTAARKRRKRKTAKSS